MLACDVIVRAVRLLRLVYVLFERSQHGLLILQLTQRWDKVPGLESR